MEAGVRHVKNHFSEYLRRVKRGETVVITERRVPVAKLAPVDEAKPQAVLELVSRGMASWGGGKPRGLAVPVSIAEGASVADFVVEDRR